jgi:hypothetical protein
MIAGCVIKIRRPRCQTCRSISRMTSSSSLRDYPPQKARERNKENSRAWFSTDRVPCHVPATVDDKAYQVGSPIRPTEGPLPRTAVTFPSGGPCAKSCRSRCRDAVTQVTHYSHVPARQSSAPLFRLTGRATVRPRFWQICAGNAGC